MIDSPETLKARLTWITLYQQTQNAGLVCRRCGISRPTLRARASGSRRRERGGIASPSKEKKASAPAAGGAKRFRSANILSFKSKRCAGSSQEATPGSQTAAIGTGPAAPYPSFHFNPVARSQARNNVSATLRPRRRLFTPKRYSLSTPGERVQIDSCKIGTGLYQFTAIDDCTRLRVLGLYSNHQTASAIDFVSKRASAGSCPFPFSGSRRIVAPSSWPKPFSSCARSKR